MKVLIVDDDPASRELMGDIISLEGHDLRSAADGYQALSLFKEFKPHLVFSDIQMPKMDGLELLKRIRNMNPETLVVMVTGYGSEEYALKALRLRANNYLKKPVRSEDILGLLEKYSALVEPVAGSLGQEKTKEDQQQQKFIFENDLSKIRNYIYLLVKDINKDVLVNDCMDVRVGLYELLANAIEHGNMEISKEEKFNALNKGSSGIEELYEKRRSDPHYAGRRIVVELTKDDVACEWLIRDEGNGFEHEHVLRNAGPMGSIAAKGIFIAQFHFDKLEFLGRGNEVRARKLKTVFT